MLKKLLFLDIDGVLNTSGKYFNKDLNAGCLHQLERVLRATGADVVISSQWRCHKYMMEFLKPLIESMGSKIAGSTKQIDLYKRIEEIENFLERVEPPFVFAVIDDEYKYFYGEVEEPVQSNYGLHKQLVIVADRTKGLTQAEVDKLIEILNQV